MAIEGQARKDVVTATENLSTYQYHVVALGGARAAHGATGHGVLLTKPYSGENGTLAIEGKTKVKAGGTIVAGSHLKITASGTVAQCGSGSLFVGKALEAVASGAILSADMHPARPVYMQSSFL